MSVARGLDVVKAASVLRPANSHLPIAALHLRPLPASHLPFRRAQRYRTRQTTTIEGLAIRSYSSNPPSDNGISSASHEQSSTSTVAEGTSPSSSKHAEKPKTTRKKGPKEKREFSASARDRSPGPSAQSPPQSTPSSSSSSPSSSSSSSSSSPSSSSPGPSRPAKDAKDDEHGSPETSKVVRVTDNRSDAESRQADIASREAVKQREQEKVDQVKAALEKQNQQASDRKDNEREVLTGTVRPRQQPPQQGQQQQQQQQQQQSPSDQSRASAEKPENATAAHSQPSSTPSSAPSQSSPKATSATTSTSGSSNASPSPPPLSSAELLKQRLQQAQERLERPLGSTVQGGGGINVDSDGVIVQNVTRGSGNGKTSATRSSNVPPGGPASSANTPSRPNPDQGQSQGSGSVHDSPSPGAGGPLLPSGPVIGMQSVVFRPAETTLDHLFDTRAFVKRLEDGGFLNLERLREAELQKGDAGQKGETLARQEEVLKWIQGSYSQGTTSDTDAEKASSDQTTALAPPPSHTSHDPAEAIMELTRGHLKDQGHHVLSLLLNRVEVENQRYLFTAALSELRTEMQVRARTDAAALRSITTLLQREVDSLSQKMRQDIENMKHDIQVDMNNRKGEAKEEQNSLEQEIQDLNNRFTISLSDLKTEIEQSIKWDLTRRALALVFGIAAITVISLFFADYLSKRKERLRNEEKEKEQAAAMAAAGGLYPLQGPGGQYPNGTYNASYPPPASSTSAGGGLMRRRPNGKGQTQSSSSSPPAPLPSPQGRPMSPQSQMQQQQQQGGAGATPGAGSTGGGPSAAAYYPELTLRPAEELGLVEQYEPDQEGRYV